MKSFSMYVVELRANLVWHIAWLASFIGFLAILVIIYPGKKVMESFLTIMQQSSYFQDVLGNFSTATAGYYFWISFMLPFVIILLLMYAMMTGVRTAVQSVTEGTGELLHTMPVSRTNFLITRAIANFTYIIGYFILQTVIFSIPVGGNTIKLNYLLNIAWWGLLFSIFGLLLGILVGLVAGNATKGYQLSIILILVFYVVQVLERIYSSLIFTNNINPLAFYEPDQYIIGLKFVKNEKIFGFTYYYYPVVLFLLSIVLIILSIYEFNRKDLTNDAGIHFNLFKRLSLKEYQILSPSEAKILGIILSPFIFIKRILFPENVRNNPFVFWARPLEKKLPITADFIYSDNMLLFIAFIAGFLFYPVQIGYYPGDASARGLASSGTIFNVFTYGHSLITHPYLFYIVASAIGVTWMIVAPCAFFWVRKAIRNDGNSGTGEIFGGIPINSKSVVLQRFLAIFLELALISASCGFWLILSEALSGKTYNQLWEVLALFPGMIPLYIFLIAIFIVISLLFKQKGGLITGVVLIGVILSFIISALNSSFDKWYLRGIFGMYDPVEIILNKSFLANGDGLVYLIILSIISIGIMIFTASRFTWLNITNQSEEAKN